MSRKIEIEEPFEPAEIEDEANDIVARIRPHLVNARHPEAVTLVLDKLEREFGFESLEEGRGDT